MYIILSALTKHPFEPLLICSLAHLSMKVIITSMRRMSTFTTCYAIPSAVVVDAAVGRAVLQTITSRDSTHPPSC